MGGGPAVQGPLDRTSITGRGLLSNTPHDVVHIVGPSETLWRISKTYDVDIKTLLEANSLSDPTKVKNGQRILVPKTYGPRPSIPLYPTRRWTHIVIHHTATHEGDAFTIDELHHKRGFWNGLGYHFLINNGTHGKLDGQIQVGPRWIKQQDGAHCNAGDMNQKGIGIVLVGNFSEQRVSQRELDSLVFLVKSLQQYYKIPNSNVVGHGDVPGKSTECPGNYFPMSEFKRRLT
jgi:LysM repeat protein